MDTLDIPTDTHSERLTLVNVKRVLLSITDTHLLSVIPFLQDRGQGRSIYHILGLAGHLLPKSCVTDVAHIFKTLKINVG